MMQCNSIQAVGVGTHASSRLNGRNHLMILALLPTALLLAGCGASDNTSTAEKATEAQSVPVQSESPSDDQTTNESGNTDTASITNETPPGNETATETASTTANVPFEEFELLTSMEVDFLSIKAIAFAPDGKTFVTGGGIPRVWQVGGDEALFEFEGLYPLTGTIVEAEALAFSPDGTTLAIAGGDGKLHLFDFETRELNHTIEAHDAGIVSVAFSGNGQLVATSGYDGKAIVWNSETGEQVSVCASGDERAMHVDLSPDGKTLASGGADALVWSAETGSKIGDLNLGEPRALLVRSAQFSPDGTQIATADATVDFENAAMIWSAESRELQNTFKHELGVMSLGFSPDGTMLATASVDAMARIWRIADGTLLQTMEEEELGTVDIVAWMPDGKALAVVSEGTIRFWGHPGAIEVAASDAADEDDLSDTDEASFEAESVHSASDHPEEVAEEDLEIDIIVPDLRPAATMEEITQALDLPNFPKIEGGDYQTSTTVQVSYLAPILVPEARKFYRERLSAAGWEEQEQPAAQLDTDESWLREFEKDGYVMRLFLNKLSAPSEDQLIVVEFLHMGNVDTRELPAPPDAEKTYEGVVFTSFTTSMNSPEVVEFMRAHFKKLDWKEHSFEDGAYGTKLTLVQNAVRLQARVMMLGGKTTVSYDVMAIGE